MRLASASAASVSAGSCVRTGLVGVSRRKKAVTTLRVAGSRPAPDLVERRFEAERPNQLWVTDITYIPTLDGFLFLAVVLDVWSRRVVGWAMANHLRTELVTSALNMAVAVRRPESVVLHSDQGCQYTSVRSGCGAALPACGRPWVLLETATTMRCARASSRRWSASCSTVVLRDRPRRRDLPCSSSSRAGTILTDVTRLSAISRLRRSRSVSGRLSAGLRLREIA
jgi:hypothetical protein